MYTTFQNHERFLDQERHLQNISQILTRESIESRLHGTMIEKVITFTFFNFLVILMYSC
ncbi:unnamed protein product [Brugia timori]|uniref:Bm14480 n=2 Tax=Brugia TaxID=6278 RepID=A0A1I9G4L9_BRUMA|nr:Bm14480 [Brugia malayi]VDO29312.1 unnamed protein product [Brugia timori]